MNDPTACVIRATIFFPCSSSPRRRKSAEEARSILHHPATDSPAREPRNRPSRTRRCRERRRVPSSAMRRARACEPATTAAIASDAEGGGGGGDEVADADDERAAVDAGTDGASRTRDARAAFRGEGGRTRGNGGARRQDASPGKREASDAVPSARQCTSTRNLNPHSGRAARSRGVPMMAASAIRTHRRRTPARPPRMR